MQKAAVILQAFPVVGLTRWRSLTAHCSVSGGKVSRKQTFRLHFAFPQAPEVRVSPPALVPSSFRAILEEMVLTF